MKSKTNKKNSKSKINIDISKSKIDPIKLNRYKANRLKGLSRTKALLDIGYTPKSVDKASYRLPLGILGEQQLANELKASDITPDYCVKKSNRIGDKAEKKELYGVALRVVEFQADIAGLINHRDTGTTHNHLHIEASAEQQSQINESIEALTDRIRNAHKTI